MCENAGSRGFEELAVMLRGICAGVICAATVGAAFGGEVLFRNGDRLTGTVTEGTDGKLTIDSAVAGKVTVPLDKVKTFTSDEPVEFKMKSGEVVKLPVVAGPQAGTVVLPETKPETVALSDVAAINPNHKKWSGSLQAGGVVTSGNSQTETLNAEVDAQRRGEDDRLTFKGEYLYGRQKDNGTGQSKTTTDAWLASAKYDYFFTKKFYGYGLMKAEHDRIADLDLRLSPSVGVGYQWVESAKQNFSTEVGVGYVYEDYSTRASNDYVSARAAYHYDRTLLDNLNLVHKFEFQPDVEDLRKYLVNADVGLRTDFTKQLFAELKVEWKYDSEPAPGARKNDFRYILSVGYQF
jgi:putative salt-induced outer membrane protein